MLRPVPGGLPASRLCIDVSNRNPITSAELSQIRPALLIAKATEGTGFRDSFLGQHRTAAAAVGCAFGSYLFLHPGSVGSEADYFWEYAQPRPGELVAVDVEVTDGRPMGEVAHRAYACLHRLEQLGAVHPLLYCSSSWWRTLVAAEPRLRGYRAWEAQYPGRLERWVPSLVKLRWRLGGGATVGLWQWTDHFAAVGRYFDASRLMMPLENLRG